jgi:hypothetical protein
MTRRARALGAAVLLLAAAAARADLPPQPLSPAYTAECASCHVAYPPALLPAASWRRVMAGLDRHYGVDASLDAATVREIAAWLDARAGTYRKVRRDAAPPPEDRITRSPWFLREHDEVPAATWRRADVRSPANCIACHRRADEGLYDEHDIRIPR